MITCECYKVPCNHFQDDQKNQAKWRSPNHFAATSATFSSCASSSKKAVGPAQASNLESNLYTIQPLTSFLLAASDLHRLCKSKQKQSKKHRQTKFMVVCFRCLFRIPFEVLGFFYSAPAKSHIQFYIAFYLVLWLL